MAAGDVSQPGHSLTARLEEVNSGVCTVLSACGQRRELDSSPAGSSTAGLLLKRLERWGDGPENTRDNARIGPMQERRAGWLLTDGTGVREMGLAEREWTVFERFKDQVYK